MIFKADWITYKTGEYKSAVEPLTSNKMSDDVREEYQGIVNGLWDVYLYELPNRHLNKKLKALFSNEQRYLDILSNRRPLRYILQFQSCT